MATTLLPGQHPFWELSLYPQWARWPVEPLCMLQSVQQSSQVRKTLPEPFKNILWPVAGGALCGEEGHRYGISLSSFPSRLQPSTSSPWLSNSKA